MTVEQLELTRLLERRKGIEAAERSAARYPRLMRQLVELAQELAWKAGSDGVTVSDVRIVATQRGIFIPRPAHFLGSLMKRAGLVKTSRSRCSDVATSHGTSHPVWVDRRFAEEGS